jgi:phospholipid transport system substrate-binding protein
LWLLILLLTTPHVSILGVESEAAAAQSTIERVTREILKAIEAKRPEIEADPSLLLGLVDNILLPTFDFAAMTRLTLGRHWRQATATQRRELVTEFRQLLVAAHATALLEYRGEDVRYLPMRPSSRPQRATVRAELLLAEGDPVLFVYRLRQREGRWLIYDVAIDGISLLTNYRATFATVVRKKGIQGLIEDLRVHNRALSRAYAPGDSQ